MGRRWERGFRRLGWVLGALCLPLVVVGSYGNALEFSGFDRDQIGELYPELDPERTVNQLHAERDDSLEPIDQELIAEARRRGIFPYAYEVRTERLSLLRFFGWIVLAEGGILLLIHGTISALAWILRGFAEK